MNDPAAPLPFPSPSSPPPRKSSKAGLLLFLGCGGFLALVVLAVFILGAVGGGGHVDSGSVLKLNLEGELPEVVRNEGLEDLFGHPKVTFRDTVENLKKAAVDKRIKGVVLVVGPLSMGWAKVEELRDALADYKKSGKFLIAYSEYLTEKEYALVLPAGTIIMPKDSQFEFNGLATDISHYPGLLEKLGVEVQYFRYGKYKSASGEQMGRKAFTEPVKEMLSTNLERTFTHFVDAVAKYRNLTAPDVRALVDEGQLKADWALDKKLIDRLAYWDEVETDVRDRLGLSPGDKLKWVSNAKYREVSPSDAGLPEGKQTFALISSVGLIVSGKGGGGGLGGGESQGSEPLIKALREATEDKEVKAIIFRVDSPGGAGLGCDYVRRELERARAKKPVIVSMSDVAASGGYWVSMDATAIVAEPSTATGSIGIYSVVPSLEGTYEKLGLNNETFKAGAHADEIIGARKMSDDEAKRFDADLYASYKRFVQLAADGRHKGFDEMQELAQGRTWLGDEALEKGLVDRLGGLDTAVEVAREKAGVPAGEPVRLRRFDRKKSFAEMIARVSEDEEEGEGVDLSQALFTSLVKASGVGPLARQVPGFTPFARVVLENREHLFPMMEYRVDYR
jgi:protease-4